MTQLLYASGLYGAMSLAAAIKAGRLGDAERRLLVVSNNAQVPELTEPFHGSPAFEAIAGHFDDVVSWNELIAPLHPSGWCPRPDDALVLGPLLRSRWDLGSGPSSLVLESVAVNPAQAIAQVFTDVPVTVYAEGLMSYGPTRSVLPRELQQRIEGLLYLDLVPGLRPLLLAEYDVPAGEIGLDALGAVLRDVGAACEPRTRAAAAGGERPAMIVGQYLSALGVLTDFEEQQQYRRMLRALAARGHRRVVLKQHPSAPPSAVTALSREAEDLGVRLEVLDPDVPAEVWVEVLRPSLVVGCFSTALVTARRLFGTPVARLGTELVLARLTPYQNSNRIPLVLVDATVPGLDGDPVVDVPVQALVDAVGYSMQDVANPQLRPAAQDLLARHLDARTARYFHPSRLGRQGLPGGPPKRRRLRGTTRARRLLRRIRG